MSDQEFRQTKLAYKQSAAKLERYWQQGGVRTRHVELVFKLANIDRPAVLELGCGPGRDAAIIIPKASSYLGIDYSTALIEIARRKVPEGVFRVGDMANSPYPAEQDIIIAFASVLHLPPVLFEKVLLKAHASLRPGGILYISTKAGQGTTVKRDEFGVRTYYFYSIEDIERLASGTFRTLRKDLEQVRGIDWVEIALQRI